MTRERAIAEEIRRIGDRNWPGHDNPHAQKIRVRTMLRLRGLPPQPVYLRHAEMYELNRQLLV